MLLLFVFLEDGKNVQFIKLFYENYFEIKRAFSSAYKDYSETKKETEVNDIIRLNVIPKLLLEISIKLLSLIVKLKILQSKNMKPISL